MCSRFLKFATVLCLALSASCFATELKVCADPDALPFSNRAGQGFENRLADILGRDLHTHVTYTWQRMGRGFVRDIVNKGACNVVLGIPSNFRQLLTTDPYYRSTYVFVTRKSPALHLASFDDPRLRKLSVGVQVVGEEYAPAAISLGRRGLVANVVGFASKGNDASSLVDAVRNGKVDTAVVWGPLAGYFAAKHPGALELTPVPEVDIPAVPYTFMISMGVRKGNVELQQRLNSFLQRHKSDIDRLLTRYKVPLLPIGSEPVVTQTAKVAH